MAWSVGRRLWDGYTVVALLALAAFVVVEVAVRLVPRREPTVVDDLPADSASAGPVDVWRDADSVCVNTASPYALRRAGFSYFHIANILHARERGFVFRSVDDLRGMRHADTALLARVGHLLSFGAPPSVAPPVPWRVSSPACAEARRERPAPRPRRVPLFLADSAEMSLAGMSPVAWDTLSAWRAAYVLSGSMTVDSLVGLGAGELARELAGRVVARRGRDASEGDAAAEAARVVDINVAAVDDLVAVPGIGPTTAERIVEFRARLGGYVSPRQLVGVWPITAETFAMMEPFLVADSSRVVPVNVNSSNDTRMRRHPYFPPLLVARIWQLKMEGGGARLGLEQVRRCAEGIDLDPFFWHYVALDGKK